MIWFWIVAGLLTLAALAVLLRPLVRRAGRGVGVASRSAREDDCQRRVGCRFE